MEMGHGEEEIQEVTHESWFLMREEELLNFFKRVQEGENIDILLLEIVANCDEENFYDEEDDDEDIMFVHLNMEIDYDEDDEKDE